MKNKILIILAVLVSFLMGFYIGFYTPNPKYCLQYFEGIKPIYNLGCIFNEADRLEKD